MTSRTPTVEQRPLPAAGVQVLESLHQHRLLSARQVHALHTPTASQRWTQSLLAELHAHGLARFVRSDGARKLWYVTDAGADAIEQLPGRPETRRKVIAPAQAAGPLRQHTLAVNDAGLAWATAARDRGDDCGPFGWRHEIAHPIGALPGRRRSELLIADALLTYLHTSTDGDATLQRRFLEVDRATVPLPALVAKLGRYARLHDYAPDPTSGQPRQAAWRSEYPAFPAVHVLLAGDPREALQRRLEQTIALAHAEPALQAATGLVVSFALLEDLTTDGPFEHIFVALNDPSQLVDWLGHPAPTTPASGQER
jgi:hypothetical protein